MAELLNQYSMPVRFERSVVISTHSKIGVFGNDEEAMAAQLAVELSLACGKCLFEKP